MEENGKCEIETIKERKGSLQSVSQYFDAFGCFNKFFFHCKWNDVRLLLINLVYTRCLTSCQTT